MRSRRPAKGAERPMKRGAPKPEDTRPTNGEPERVSGVMTTGADQKLRHEPRDMPARSFDGNGGAAKRSQNAYEMEEC